MDKSTASHQDLVEALRAVVPKLDSESYKGQAGKVGVMGGCREYTGAPFFSAMSALRMGCDLAYVFCTSDAAPVIKSYSPELIVFPSLKTSTDVKRHMKDGYTNELSYIEHDENYRRGSAEIELEEEFEKDIEKWIPKMTALVIGPGLGDDYKVGDCMYIAVKAAIKNDLPLVIDGSGINFVVSHDSYISQKLLKLVRGYKNCILTPNIAEFGRLAEAVGLKLPGKIGTHWQEHATELAAALGGPVVLSKGPQDIITDGHMTLTVTADGSPRRCGGQGDVLTGTTASFISWINAHRHKQQQQQQQQADKPQALVDVPPLMLAAYGGCLTMRAAAVMTFRDMGRSMVAGDMIQHLGDKVLDFAGLQPAGSCAPKL